MEFSKCGNNDYDYYFGILSEMCVIIVYEVFDDFDVFSGYCKGESIEIFFNKVHDHEDHFRVVDDKHNALSAKDIIKMKNEDYFIHSPYAEREVVFMK